MKVTTDYAFTSQAGDYVVHVVLEEDRSIRYVTMMTNPGRMHTILKEQHLDVIRQALQFIDSSRAT